MRLLGGTSDNGPHKYDKQVWAKRPLAETSIAYAAHDVHIIGLLLSKYRETDVPESFMQGVMAHSERYVNFFRNHPYAVSWPRDKNLTMKEEPIVSLAVLTAFRQQQAQAAAAARVVRNADQANRFLATERAMQAMSLSSSTAAGASTSTGAALARPATALLAVAGATAAAGGFNSASSSSVDLRGLSTA